MNHSKQYYAPRNDSRNLGVGSMLITLALFGGRCLSFSLMHTPNELMCWHITNFATASVTIEKMRNIFATFGSQLLTIFPTSLCLKNSWSHLGYIMSEQLLTILPPMALQNVLFKHLNLPSRKLPVVTVAYIKDHHVIINNLIDATHTIYICLYIHDYVPIVYLYMSHLLS